MLMHRGASAAIIADPVPAFIVDVVDDRPAVAAPPATPQQAPPPAEQPFIEPPPPAPAERPAPKPTKRLRIAPAPADRLKHREDVPPPPSRDVGGEPVSASGALASPSAPSANGEAVRLARTSYSAELLSLLNKHKEYPPVARRRGLEGTVLVRIDLLRDGSLHGYRVEKSSGFDILDESATTLVAKATPYPPLPESIPGARAVFLVPVTFKLN